MGQPISEVASSTILRRQFLGICAAGAVALNAAPTTLADNATTVLARDSTQDSVRGPIETVTVRSLSGLPVVVTAMDVDPQGGFIALACEDDEIQILDATTLRKRTSLRGHRDRIRSIAVDRDGERMASVGNDGRLILWSTESGGFEKQRSLGNTPALARVRFSPDSSRLAAVGFTPSIFMISAEGRSMNKWQCSHTDLRTVAFRDDGKSIVVAGRGGTVHGHDGEGTDTFTRELHRGAINEMRFLPSTGRLVTIGDDGNVVSFDTDDDKIVSRVSIRQGKLFSIAVISSDTVAVAGSDDDIRIVNLSEGAVVETLRGHRGSVVGLAMSGGHLISAGYDATVRRWQVDRPASQRVATTEALER